MAKNIYLNFQNKEQLVKIGKALSSPVRIEMLRILRSRQMMSIADIARTMRIPASSAAMHIKNLKEAKLIWIVEQPGTRGLIKLCGCDADRVQIRLSEISEDVSNVISQEMPIGLYTDCQITKTCGIADENGNNIGEEDSAGAYYLPERMNAQILWSSSGYVEYKFNNALYSLNQKIVPTGISVSAELCSEASGYRMDWKSDITLWINGVDCGTFTSPSDFGDRRGRNNPAAWMFGRTQYGLLTAWEVREDGNYINGTRISGLRTENLHLLDRPEVTVRIGIKENAVYSGGFNLFGKKFGDYSQDIVLVMSYRMKN